ncbi:MAG: Crp/Fnr family transcriptional regulator [Rhodoferax sp.]|uniref:Crp/Fnr family transcriptional regulator n=1 Tax=Rhodoferax sp. TaxID=50421 RepID=UPI00301B402B
MNTPNNPPSFSVSPYAVLSGSPQAICFDPCLSDLGGHAPDASTARTMPNPMNSQPKSFWRESLALIEKHMTFDRRTFHAGETAYRCNQNFENLYLVNSGLFKIVNLAIDGRQQTTGLHFKGDWLGFDGIPSGRYACSAVALDLSEIWVIRYEALLEASALQPSLMRLVMAAICAQLAHNREATLSMGTLPADARVADFLLQWAHALSERGMRTDQINIHMSRAEMGNYLGLRVESVSRALTRLARSGVIEFNERARRDISVPNLAALRSYIQKCTDPTACLMQ